MSTANPYETPSANVSAVARRTFTLKRVDILSVGIMFGALYAIVGLIFGGFMALFAVFGIAIQEGATMAGIAGGMMGIFLMPLIYGVMGFIGGVILGVIYNVCASVAGGIKFDLE